MKRKIFFKGRIFNLSGLHFLQTDNKVYKLGFLRQTDFSEKKGKIYFSDEVILPIINKNEELYKKANF